MEDVWHNHDLHEVSQNRVIGGTLSPQLAKSFGSHVARIVITMLAVSGGLHIRCILNCSTT